MFSGRGAQSAAGPPLRAARFRSTIVLVQSRGAPMRDSRTIRSFLAAALMMVAACEGAAAQSVPSQAMSRYSTSIYSLILMHSRPPHARISVPYRGVVVVQFTIDRQGKLVRCRAIKGFGSTTVDDVAKRIVRRASQYFPAPPPGEMTGDVVTFAVPLRF